MGTLNSLHLSLLLIHSLAHGSRLQACLRVFGLAAEQRQERARIAKIHEHISRNYPELRSIIPYLENLPGKMEYWPGGLYADPVKYAVNLKIGKSTVRVQISFSRIYEHQASGHVEIFSPDRNITREEAGRMIADVKILFDKLQDEGVDIPQKFDLRAGNINLKGKEDFERFLPIFSKIVNDPSVVVLPSTEK